MEIALSVDTSGVGLRDGADRNVDVLMLTQNTSDWERRLSDETTNLPGDGLLSQVGRTLSPCLILAPLPQSPLGTRGEVSLAALLLLACPLRLRSFAPERP